MNEKRGKHASYQKEQAKNKQLLEQIPFDPLSQSKRSAVPITLLRRLIGLLGEDMRRRVSFVLDKALWHDHRVLGSSLGDSLSLDLRCPDGPTVLVVRHPLFDKDLTEIDRLGRINWIMCSKNALGSTQREFLRDTYGGQRIYFESLADPGAQPYWRMAEEFGIVLLAHADRLRHVDAVISSHVDYWQDEGLRRACASLGRPFLVLCHENYNITRSFRSRKREFMELGFRFGGTAIATFSDHMRDLFIDAGICEPDRVVVTGASRLDGWRSLTMNPKRRVVLLSFLEAPTKKRKKYYSDKACLEILDGLIRRYTEGGDFELVVKCKGMNDEKMIRQHVGDVPGLKIYRDTPLTELIPGAAAVVGFNTLAMVEALLSDANLIVPRWGETDRPTDELQFNPNDPLTREIIKFTGSSEDLVKEVEAALDKPGHGIDRAARRTLMQRFIHFSEDIPSAIKAADFVEHFARHTSSTRRIST